MGAMMGQREARFRRAEEALWRQFGATPVERTVDLRRVGSKVRIPEIGSGPSA
ncbi:MAG: hypothetical protein ACKVVT_11660 [Dehalococcoidia bacterium]